METQKWLKELKINQIESGIKIFINMKNTY